MAAPIGALRAELSASAVKFAEDMGKAAGSVRKFGRTFEKVGKRAQALGQNMSLRITAPIVALGGAVLKMAGDFEAAMNRVQAITGATGDDFKRMRDLAMELGKTTQFSASQAADGMEVLAKNGLDVTQILGGAVDASLKLAAATGAQLAPAADVVTDAMLAFGKEAGDLPMVVDQITNTTLNSKLGFEAYADALGQAGGAAATLGFEFNEFNAALATTVPFFKGGAQAGAAFKTFMLALPDAAEKAQSQFSSLNLEFFDTEGNFKTLSGIADELQDKLGNLVKEQQAKVLGDIFGTRGIATAGALLKAGGDAIEEMTGKIDRAGTAQEQAAARLKGFNGELKKLQSALEGLAIAIADAGVLEWATNLVTSLTALTANLSDTEASMLAMGSVAAIVAAALGPLLIGIGLLISGLGSVITVVGTVGAAIAALGAGPLLLIGAAIAGVVVAWQKWDQIPGIVEAVSNAVSKWLRSRIGPDLVDFLGGAIQFVIDKFRALFRFVDEFTSKFRSLQKLAGSDISVGKVEVKSFDIGPRPPEGTTATARTPTLPKGDKTRLVEETAEVQQFKKALADLDLELAVATGKFAGLAEGVPQLASSFGLLTAETTKISPEVAKLNERMGRLAQFKQAAEIIEATKSATERYKEELIILNNLLEEGFLNQDQYNQALKLTRERLEEATDGSKTLASAGDQIGDSLGSAFSRAIVEGGKLSDVLKGLADDLLSIVSTQLITKPIAGLFSNLLGSFGGGGGGGLGGLFGSLFGGGGGGVPIPTLKPAGFRTGGSFKVGGIGGADSQLVQFNATPGERVDITPSGESMGGAGMNIDLSNKVEVNLHGVEGDPQVEQSGDGQRIDVFLDDSVAGNIRPGTRTFNALQRQFAGLSPRTVRR